MGAGPEKERGVCGFRAAKFLLTTPLLLDHTIIIRHG